MSSLERAITAHVRPLDAAAFERQRADCFSAAECAVPVASFHRAVGRVQVEPSLLAQVVAVLHQGGDFESNEPVLSDFSGFVNGEAAFPQVTEHTLLRPFFQTVGRRLLDVVRAQPYRVPNAKGRILTLEAGPYERSSSNAWHRDTDFFKDGEMSHTLVLHGPLTRHANGLFEESDFLYEMLNRSLPQDQWQSYELGEVVMHDGFAGAHEAPPPEFNGLLRIFMKLRSADQYT